MDDSDMHFISTSSPARAIYISEGRNPSHGTLRMITLGVVILRVLTHRALILDVLFLCVFIRVLRVAATRSDALRCAVQNFLSAQISCKYLLFKSIQNYRCSCVAFFIQKTGFYR